MHQAAFSIVCGPLLTFAACKVDVLKNTPLGGFFPAGYSIDFWDNKFAIFLNI